MSVALKRAAATSPALAPWVRDLIDIRPIRPDEFARIACFTPPERVPTLHAHPTLVASIYDEVVAYGSYYLDGHGMFYHGALRVLDAWQREGIGTRLMKARVEIAKDFHAPAHHCIVWTHKPIMAALCEQFGMTPAERWDDRILYVGSLLEAP